MVVCVLGAYVMMIKICQHNISFFLLDTLNEDGTTTFTEALSYFFGVLTNREQKKNEIENEFPIKRREETTLTCDISNKQKTKKNRSILGIHELNEWVSE